MTQPGSGTSATALLAGANGLVGSFLSQYLDASDRFQTVCVPNRLPFERPGSRLELVDLDFNHLDRWQRPLEQIFCCLGTTIKKAGTKEGFRKVDFGYVVGLGQLAKRLDAKLAIISSIGADPTASSFYLRTKGEAELALKALNLRQLVILQPSVMFEGRTESRPGEHIVGLTMKLLQPLMVGALRNYRPIHPSLVAKTLAESSRQLGPGNHVLTGETIRQFDQGH